MSLGDHWQRQYEHMKKERDELRELYKAAQELNHDIVMGVTREKERAWDEGYSAGSTTVWNGETSNPYREGE